MNKRVLGPSFFFYFDKSVFDDSSSIPSSRSFAGSDALWCRHKVRRDGVLAGSGDGRERTGERPRRLGGWERRRAQTG